MAKHSGHVVVTVSVANGRGLKALREAVELAAELRESQPWNDEAKELHRRLKTVVRELKFKSENQ